MIPPSGADEQVYTYIAKTLCNALNILSENISSMGNKRALIEESAADVKLSVKINLQMTFIILPEHNTKISNFHLFQELTHIQISKCLLHSIK